MFKDEIEAAMGTSMHGLSVRVYDNWADWWNACGLNREMLVKHDDLGNERLSPERDTQYYTEKFFTGDTYGAVFSDANGPVTGVIISRTAPDTVEYRLRVGKLFPGTGMRRALWDVGIRKMLMRVRADNPRAHRRIRYREQVHERNTFTERDRPDLGAGYKEFAIEFKQKPADRYYDYGPET